jgi:fructose-bisphosphate aldolase, class I
MSNQYESQVISPDPNRGNGRAKAEHEPVFRSAKLRTRRLFHPRSNRTLLVPMDHGVTVGPIAGIEDVRGAITEIVDGSANGIILHKGCIKSCHDLLLSDHRLSVLLHVSGSVALSPQSNYKVQVATVEEGVRLGADGISVHVNIGPEDDAWMLGGLGQLSETCDRFGMPLLAMMYCRGAALDERSADNIAHAARVAMELGADIVKVSYPGDATSFERIVRSVTIPVVVAGGSRHATLRAFFDEIHDALKAGAAGVAVGRNIFQQKSPRQVVAGLHALLHEDASPEEALGIAHRVALNAEREHPSC